jgi:hypothetical protein
MIADIKDYMPNTLSKDDGVSSIQSVNWSDFRTIDLFAGIGGIRLGFEAVGGGCVFSSDTFFSQFTGTL